MSCAFSNNSEKKLQIYVSPCETVILGGTTMDVDSKQGIFFINGHIFAEEDEKIKINILNNALLNKDSSYTSLKETNGQFSIIHYNEVSKKLILAIDQFGIKSFYYSMFDRGLVFASNLSSIFASTLIKPKFSSEIFLLNSTVRMDAVSDLTWFDGVKQLEPGELISIEANNNIVAKRYWLPPSDEKIVKEVDVYNLFRKATKIRSKTSNLAVFLSGGVDSSAVASALLRDGTAFTPCMFSYKDVPENKNVDLVYAQRFLKHNKQTGELIHIENNNFYEVLKKIVSILHRPIVHGCEIGMYFTYNRLSKIGCKTVYTGTGADIMWGEQDSQYFPILSPNFKVDMHSEYYLKNFLYQNDTKEQYAFLINNFYNLLQINPQVINDLIWEKIFYPYRLYSPADLFKKPRLHELYRNVAYINHMNNFLSSYFGMDEVPVFQDLHLACMAFQLPEFIKNKSNEYSLKPFLKKALEPILPKFILKRKKFGFPPPNTLLWKNELINILDFGLPFEMKIKKEELNKMPFTELIFLVTTKIWMEEFNLC